MFSLIRACEAPAVTADYPGRVRSCLDLGGNWPIPVWQVQGRVGETAVIHVESDAVDRDRPIAKIRSLFWAIEDRRSGAPSSAASRRALQLKSRCPASLARVSLAPSDPASATTAIRRRTSLRASAPVAASGSRSAARVSRMSP